MSHVPPLVWEQIRELGGRSAVQKLVLEMLGELADAWEKEAAQRTQGAAQELLLGCAAQVRARLEMARPR